MMERVVCLNCIDGRAQLPVINWIKSTYDVEHVDMITEPGMDGLLKDKDMAEYVFIKTRLSIEANNSKIIFICGHHDCKGNPVTDDEHKQCLSDVKEIVKKEFPDIEIVNIFVDSNWVSNKLD